MRKWCWCGIHVWKAPTQLCRISRLPHQWNQWTFQIVPTDHRQMRKFPIFYFAIFFYFWIQFRIIFNYAIAFYFCLDYCLAVHILFRILHLDVSHKFYLIFSFFHFSFLTYSLCQNILSIVMIYSISLSRYNVSGLWRRGWVINYCFLSLHTPAEEGTLISHWDVDNWPEGLVLPWWQTVSLYH